MSFDFKKAYKEFYAPSKKPVIIEIPPMNFLAVRGAGDPNETDGDYSKAIELLYSVAYTIKMSHKGQYKIDGFFEYVVPPLEGLWWQEHIKGVDYTNKAAFKWISIIRLPDFVQMKDFAWAIDAAAKKKKLDYRSVEFFTYNEGLCVQSMHVGSYDDEPATILMMDKYANENGCSTDLNVNRYHHEIYLSDPRKVDVAKLKTIIRHPVKKI